MAKQTASQTVGPFFLYGLTPELADGIRYTGYTANVLATADTAGEHIVVEGRVLDGEGDPVPDSMVEIWQANAAGRYRHEEDDRADVPLDDNFRGFGRTGTDRDGAFRFHTVKPGPVPGLGNAWQAPHIVVCVFARGMLSHAYTRLYFSDEAEANAADPVLGSGRCCAPAHPDRRTGAEPRPDGLPLRHPPPGRRRDGVLRCLTRRSAGTVS